MPPGLQELIAQVEALVDRIDSEPPRCREFRLYRHSNVTGQQSAEVVGCGVVLPSGWTVMEFTSAPLLRESWPGITELIAAYNDGRTDVIFLDRDS